MVKMDVHDVGSSATLQQSHPPILNMSASIRLDAMNLCGVDRSADSGSDDKVEDAGATAALPLLAPAGADKVRSLCLAVELCVVCGDRASGKCRLEILHFFLFHPFNYIELHFCKFVIFVEANNYLN
jgi:hypothetical protein